MNGTWLRVQSLDVNLITTCLLFPGCQPRVHLPWISYMPMLSFYIFFSINPKEVKTISCHSFLNKMIRKSIVVLAPTWMSDCIVGYNCLVITNHIALCIDRNAKVLACITEVHNLINCKLCGYKLRTKCGCLNTKLMFGIPIKVVTWLDASQSLMSISTAPHLHMVSTWLLPDVLSFWWL
jgi:hypothetical protein